MQFIAFVGKRAFGEPAKLFRQITLLNIDNRLLRLFLPISDTTVYIDGEFKKGDEAKISVWDHAVMYGDTVFDTARVYDGKIFRLDEHIDRLFD